MVHWIDVRWFYSQTFARAKQTRGLTQADVAQGGGLSGQNAVSKLMDNETDGGPRIETVLRAIHGLGLTPAAFFTQLEQAQLSAAAAATVAGGGGDGRLHAEPSQTTDHPPALTPGEIDAIVQIHIGLLRHELRGELGLPVEGAPTVDRDADSRRPGARKIRSRQSRRTA